MPKQAAKKAAPKADEVSTVLVNDAIRAAMKLAHRASIGDPVNLAGAIDECRKLGVSEPALKKLAKMGEPVEWMEDNSGGC